MTTKNDVLAAAMLGDTALLEKRLDEYTKAVKDESQLQILTVVETMIKYYRREQR